MAFPEFASGREGVLWFSRGRGRGHAIPDLEIAREWEAIAPSIDVRFVSYATGADTIEAAGRPLIRLDMPERGSTADMTVYAGRLIGTLDPRLVVAHEEFSALPAAKIFAKPTVLITDWFTSPDMHSMQCSRFADRIVFTDETGIYDEPQWARGRIDYVGPILRRFEYSREDRVRARRELSIPDEAFFVAVLPGSWTEEMLASFDLIAAAYRFLPEPKRMTWVAGADASRLARFDGLSVVEFDPRIDRLICAADIAITKCNRKTLLELDWLGVPSVSIRNETNPIDFQRACALPLNLVLPEAADAEFLARALRETALRRAVPERRENRGAEAAARILASIAI